MRIILKPFGAILVAAAFLTVLGLLWQQKNGRTAGASAAATAATPVPPAASAAALSGAANRIVNPGFENEYRPVHPSGEKAVLRGTTPEPWRDDSGWARVYADYARERLRPHGGAHALKLSVHSVKHVENDLDSVQLVQELPLEARRYRGGIWVRADRDVPVTLTVRQAAEPFAVYGTRTATIGTEWQQLTVDADVPAEGKAFVMVNVPAAATVWVDDATLTEAAAK